ncbi:MAG TPA: metallophosphoesterase family protein [Gaiellaceae bacterium]|nr:metallophosphoesterase family protein [Gaiellaceae bacterium]
MRVAVLNDVHAMPWALEAVLAQLDADADAIVFGGDFLGGPCPRETLEIVRSLDATLIRGNAERDVDDWDSSLLDADEVAWLAALPMAAELDGVLYCHATPTSDLLCTTAVTEDAEILRMFGGVTGTVVIGHTHHQFDRRVGDLRVVNAGSVGMAYEGEVAAFWALVDGGEPEHRRTPIDVEMAVAGIRASGWPTGDEFIAENLRIAVTREEAIAYMESMPR